MISFPCLALPRVELLLTNYSEANHRRAHTSVLFQRSNIELRKKSVRCKSTVASDSIPQVTKGAQLSHIDVQGRPHMVDVTSKDITSRSATATGTIHLNELAFSLLVAIPSHSADGDREDQNTVHSTTDPTASQLSKARLKTGASSNVLTVAQLAGIMAAKSTSTLIPLCHPLALTQISVNLRVVEDQKAVECVAIVKCDGKTGVEMEALTAVSVALLTVWDMLKKVGGRDMVIGSIKVSEKKGGKSGDFRRVSISEELADQGERE